MDQAQGSFIQHERREGGPSAQDAKSSELLVRSINWKRVISAVHGYAVGMGTGLALECNLVVAEEGTKFQVTETPRGLAGYINPAGNIIPYVCRSLVDGWMAGDLHQVSQSNRTIQRFLRIVNQ